MMKLFQLSVLDHPFYAALASNQHEIIRTLFPERGSIFTRDKHQNMYLIAGQKEYFHMYAVPLEIDRPQEIANQIFPFVYEPLKKTPKEDTNSPEDERETWLWEIELEHHKKRVFDQLLARLSKENDPYEPLKQKVTQEEKQAVEALQLKGVYFSKQRYRYYPENEYTSHITGFVRFDDQGKQMGQYGLEGFFNQELTGRTGSIQTEKDAIGRWIAFAEKMFVSAQDGIHLVLSVDKNIQYKACEALYAQAQKLQAEGGVVIIMEPNTGEILAMCSYPYYDSNTFNMVANINTYNNLSIFHPYEPGSVFKPITMAIALEKDLITPDTTYEDKGEIKIGGFTIRNADVKAHGKTTMTEVLIKSLNLGTVFVANRIGNEDFVREVKRYGFGQKTGITMDFESAGNVTSLERERDIYSATASFGQGITVTPLQLVQVFSAFANNGKLMKPYIVKEMRKGDDIVMTQSPEMMKQIVSEKTATILTGMLVSVIEHGHARKASVNGYYLAGKTGTAQVASPQGGYEKDKFIHSFIGYGPVDEPRFVMLTRIDYPKVSAMSVDTAAPLFSEIASFILQYYEIPKDY